MRKTFELEDLDCANCAAKMENAVRGIEGVTFVSVSFMTQKMIVEFREGADPKAVMKAVLKNCIIICISRQTKGLCRVTGSEATPK